jgi:peroxin-6
MLIYNLTTDSDAVLPELSIQPCPFGQRPPPIPTAQSVTVAKVASPVTTQRKYQPILLRALRKYFDGKRRLLKKGDFIAVAVDVSNAAIFEDGLDGAEGRAKQESLDEIIDLSVFSLHSPIHSFILM